MKYQGHHTAAGKEADWPPCDNCPQADVRYQLARHQVARP